MCLSSLWWLHIDGHCQSDLTIPHVRAHSYNTTTKSVAIMIPSQLQRHVPDPLTTFDPQ